MAVKQVVTKCGQYQLNYEIYNQNADKTILILHGWGANKEIMIKAFASYLGGFRQIYLDLPGMGKSSITSPLNSRDYAEITSKFAQNFTQIDIIMGHSFGGKIATLMQPKFLILLSTAGIIQKKRPYVRFKICATKFLKLIGLGVFAKIFRSKDVGGMSSVMYETFKNVVNEDLTKEFMKRDKNGKTLIFWGKNDTAVNLQSGEKIASFIGGSKFFPLEGDHFFFLLHAEFISNIISQEFNQPCSNEDDSAIIEVKKS